MKTAAYFIISSVPCKNSQNRTPVRYFVSFYCCNFNRISYTAHKQLHLFSDCEKLLCFRYYDGTTLDCLGQTEPLVIKKDNTDRLRKFIKNKHKTQCTGIENEAFQDETETPPLKSSNSLEELTSVSKQETSIGAKKKCVNGLVRSESTNIGGTKKKVLYFVFPRFC